MKVGFVRPELRHLDEVAAEALALSVFADERPLRGAAGYVDWRLNGCLTRWITGGRFGGAFGEALLYPERGRLSFDRIVLFGLGPSEGYDNECFGRAVRRLLRTLRDMGVSRFATSVPGRRRLVGHPRQQVEQLLAAAATVFLEEPSQPVSPEILIVEDPETRHSASEGVQLFLRRLNR